mmetsp:Transcript_718/g.2121  ORF Transcript_718/g.2121 Transcript_718/m.2121 type:complete len:234 (-) Transcript_718:129-830(-)
MAEGRTMTTPRRLRRLAKSSSPTMSVLIIITALLFEVYPCRAVGMGNPASVHCESMGGTVEIRKDESGNKYGICVLEDGNECEEWSYFRGECGASSPSSGEGEADEVVGPTMGGEGLTGGSVVAGGVGMANLASVHCAENGGTLDIRKNNSVADEVGATGGSPYHVCVFDDESECEEWAYFRDECGPGGKTGGRGKEDKDYSANATSSTRMSQRASCVLIVVAISTVGMFTVL